MTSMSLSSSFKAAIACIASSLSCAVMASSCMLVLAAPLLALGDLETPFAAAPPKRPLKAVARLPYAASTDAALQFAAPDAAPGELRAEAAATVGAARLEAAKRAYALAHATSVDTCVEIKFAALFSHHGHVVAEK